MGERPIDESVQGLTELRDNEIPTGVDSVFDLVRGDLDNVRRLVEQAQVPGVSAQVGDVAADMLRRVRGLGDEARAVVSSAASEIEALRRPAIHVSSTSRADRAVLKNPPSDRVVVVDETAVYTTGQRGRVITVRATLTERPPGKRNPQAQRTLRGKLDGDDAGHLIGRMLGGIGDELNLTAMEAYKVNRGRYRRLERKWERAVRAGHTVDLTMRLTYKDDGFRPAHFEIEFEIDDEIQSMTIMNTPASPKERP